MKIFEGSLFLNEKQINYFLDVLNTGGWVWFFLSSGRIFLSIFALKNDRIIFAWFPHFYSLNLFSFATDDQNQGPSCMLYFAP